MVLILIAALVAAPVAAKPACPSPATPPAAPWNAWSNAGAAGPDLVVGRPRDMPVAAVANVRLAGQPSRPLSGSYLATGSFVVRQAGTYRVAAGGVAAPIRPLWLDIAGADRKPLVAAGHGHGPDCTSITKVVEYRLTPGRYTLLATGLTTDAPIRVLILADR